jgi:phosphatidylinositol-3-phosphatase
MKGWVFAVLTTFLFAGLGFGQTGQVPQSQHIWVITEENHSYEQVIGNTDMPYFNSLATTYALATQYYSTQHNSLGALMWLVSGEEVTTDADPDSCFNVDNMVRHLAAQNSTWKSYEEDLPYAGFEGTSWNNYVRRHNPLIDFTDSCYPPQSLNSVPFTQLATDMQNNATPNYVYITPNLEDDAHNGTLAQADGWLSQQVPAILALPEFQPGGDGLLFVVWDEGNLNDNGSPDDRCTSVIETGCGGRLATLLIGPQVKPAYQSTVTYMHPNLIATVCAMMGFTSCPGAGALASPMTDFFNTVNVTNPPPNAVVASPVEIQATTSNSSPVYAVQVYVDSVLEYKADGNQVNTALPMSTGQHTIVVQSWDTNGGIHKASVNVTVQSEAVVVTSPAANALVSSPVAIVATGEGQSSVYAMQVYVDNALQYQTYSSSVNTSVTMSAGQHDVVVQAWDKSGAVTKNGFYVTVAAPSVTVSSPAPGYSGYSPIFLLATTQDPNPVYAVQAYVDNALVYQYTGTGIQADTLNMTAGTHNLVVQAWDVAGGIYKQSETVNVTPIVVTVASPLANASVSSPVQVSASVPGNAPVTAIQIYVDNVLSYSGNGLSVNASLSMTPGPHYLVAKAWDTGGGTWTTSLNITVVNSSGVTITSPSNGSTVSSPVQFTASAVASNCAGGINAMQIYPTPGWLDYSVHASQLNTSLSLSPGTYSYGVVQAWDNCGNTYKSNVSFTVP